MEYQSAVKRNEALTQAHRDEKKPDTKYHKVLGSIYMKFQKRQIRKDGKENDWWLPGAGRLRGNGEWLLTGSGFDLGVMKCSGTRQGCRLYNAVKAPNSTGLYTL